MVMHPLTVLGIELPSDSPWFLSLVGIHILAGLTCTITGIVAMLSEKRTGRHPGFGTTYYWSLCVVFASSAVLSVLRWSEDYPLFALGTLAFAAASLGRSARRRRWRGWARVHIAGMGASYVLLLTAFYVDNGKNLPFWRDLPAIAYWLLPAAVGLPLIFRALLHHPVVRQGE